MKLTPRQSRTLLRQAAEAEAATAAVERGDEPDTCPPVFADHGPRLRRIVRNATIVEESQ